MYVRFDATLQRETHPLCLPANRQTRLHGRDLASVIYVEGERLCLEDVVDPRTGALSPLAVAAEAVSEAGGALPAKKKARRLEKERQDGGDVRAII